VSGAPVRSDQVTAVPVEWLWKDRIPRGMITVVAGRPDQGKGLFAAHLAAHASQQGIRVLYSAAEDSHGVMTRPRLEAAGAVLGRILLWRFQLPSQQLELFELITKHKIGLIVIDPLASHLSSGISRHSDNIREVLAPLTNVIEKSGTSVVIIELALKRVPPSGHPINAIGGSGSGLPAAARAAFLFGIDPGDPDKRVLTPVKFNIGPKPATAVFEMDTLELPGIGEIPLLLFDADQQKFDAMLLFNSRPGETGRPADKRASAAKWLTTYLVAAGAPVPSKKVYEDAKQYGMSTRTLRRACEDMEVVKRPASGPKCCWELSDDLKKAVGIPVTSMKMAPQPISVPQPAGEGGDWDDALSDLIKPQDDSDE
jgi:AAA domain